MTHSLHLAEALSQTLIAFWIEYDNRWEEKFWRFERRGSRLQWTEFPIVVFDDQSGRFDSTPGGRRLRILHYWEPNEAQLREIRKGVLVNPRGSRSKGLRGSERRGYRSVGGLHSQSTSVIGYSESWSIDGLPDLPVFTRDDTMGSARTETLEGRTRYTAQEVGDGGRLVRGLFVRDGTRKGSFVMRRAAEAIVMGGKKGERARDARQDAPRGEEAVP